MNAQWLLPLFFLATLEYGDTSCPSSTDNEDTKPLYLLALLANYGNAENNLLAANVAQEEINNRSDILPGYHIEIIQDTTETCSSLHAGIGLSNLVKHTVNPPCRPVVAVMGLQCATQTSKISPVACHKGFDLIQLSKATSPEFELQNERFSHLWRFRGAAIAYTDTILAIMDQFNWTRVGIVYNIESPLYTGVAKDVEQKIKQSSNKSVAFSMGIGGSKAYFLDPVISNIKSMETGVLVKLLNGRQTRALASLAYQHRLIYPHYTWIHVTNPKWLIGKGYVTSQATYRHITIHTKTTGESDNTYLVSNETFSEFSAKVQALHIKKALSGRVKLETYYYDQVWAIALAVNNSLPELKNRNLSIDDYTIGQPEITAVIEDRLNQSRFQGASGWIEFNQYHAVSTPIEVFWILDNDTYKQVGIYNPLHPLDFHVNLNSTDLPSDTVPRVYKRILISRPISIVLFILIGGVIIFTTIQLILYLCYRHHSVIKATSPFLSLLMFAGCYLFCVAALQLVTLGSFVLSPEVFTAMAIANYMLIINGISLIFITLFIKQLRVYCIFICWSKNLGNQWNTLPLLLTILSLSLFPNIVLGVLIRLKPPMYSSYYYRFFEGSLPLIELHTRIEPTSHYIFLILAVLYTTVFLSSVFYLSFRNRKIKMKNFKNTGQVVLMLSVMVITIFLTVSIGIIFLLREQEPIANAVMVTLFLIFVTACQLILFFPKILTAMTNGKLPQAQSCLMEVLSFILQRVFS